MIVSYVVLLLAIFVSIQNLCSGLRVLLASLFSLLQWQVTEYLVGKFADNGWNLQNVLIPTGVEDFPYEEAFTWVCLPMHTYMCMYLIAEI